MSENLQISMRGVEMPESPIRKLAPLAYAAQDRGVKIYRLNIGQPDLPTPQKALDVLKHIDRKTLEYSPSQGYRPLRQALVNYYDLSMHPASWSGEAPSAVSFRLGAGYFAVVFPDDAHIPQLAVGTPAEVKKIVMKVPVD